MAEIQRVAIVTGAAGGIGRAMVRGLLAARIRVAGADRDRGPLEALATMAREQGKADELLTIQTDLTSDTAADELTQATRARFGRIDILVNNAGIGPGAIRPDSWQRPLKFWEITPDQWRRFVAVHTTAPLALTNAVVPEMMRQGWGRIVNVTTSLGTMLAAGNPTYGPSKAALEALSAIMAKDLDGTGVTVNVLVPGGITNTPMISDKAGFDHAGDFCIERDRRHRGRNPGVEPVCGADHGRGAGVALSSSAAGHRDGRPPLWPGNVGVVCGDRA